jgi:16S rRNA (uracil1498-N3)-methyltransferase
MTAARFFIDAPLSSGAEIELPTHVAHHATRVLRLRDGAPIVVFNGGGGEFAAKLSLHGTRIHARVGKHDPIERESPLVISLIQSWIASDKLDWTIEKAVELGVHAIVLVPALRSVIRLTRDRSARRIKKLHDVAIAACSQCGRNRIPPIESFSTFTDALQAGSRDGAVGLLLSPQAEPSLLQVSSDTRRIALAVGPEGGFDDSEVALATQLGYRACGLGPRILRTETAGLAAVVALQGAYGDLR